MFADTLFILDFTQQTSFWLQSLCCSSTSQADDLFVAETLGSLGGAGQPRHAAASAHLGCPRLGAAGAEAERRRGDAGRRGLDVVFFFFFFFFFFF